VTFKQPSYIEDGEFLYALVALLGNRSIAVDDNIYEHKFAPEDVLGLDHVDKSGKTRTGTGEKAIVIRG
jgi:ubiquitin carboxyl-terminal hydrolase 7